MNRVKILVILREGTQVNPHKTFHFERGNLYSLTPHQRRLLKLDAIHAASVMPVRMVPRKSMFTSSQLASMYWWQGH